MDSRDTLQSLADMGDFLGQLESLEITGSISNGATHNYDAVTDIADALGFGLAFSELVCLRPSRCPHKLVWRQQVMVLH